MQRRLLGENSTTTNLLINSDESSLLEESNPRINAVSLAKSRSLEREGFHSKSTHTSNKSVDDLNIENSASLKARQHSDSTIYTQNGNGTNRHGDFSQSPNKLKEIENDVRSNSTGTDSSRNTSNSSKSSSNSSNSSNSSINSIEKNPAKRIPTWKAYLAAFFALLLLFKPTIVVMFPGFIYTKDLTKVFISENCIGSGNMNVFVFCFLEVLFACVLLKNYVIPVLMFNHIVPRVMSDKEIAPRFMTSWDGFDELKKKKIIGNCLKIVIRFSCMIQIAVLVLPYVDFKSGLFANSSKDSTNIPVKAIADSSTVTTDVAPVRTEISTSSKIFNSRQAAAERLLSGKLTTCADAGLNLKDVSALRAWIFSRDDIMAVMLWELTFIPELPLELWAHHLFIILFVSMGTDPLISFMGGPRLYPYIDLIAFWLVLGACAVFFVEMMVVRYQLLAARLTSVEKSESVTVNGGTNRNSVSADRLLNEKRAQIFEKQGKAISYSMVWQIIAIVTFFVGLPLGVIISNFDKFKVDVNDSTNSNDTNDINAATCTCCFNLRGTFFAVIIALALLSVAEIYMVIVKKAVVMSSVKKAKEARALNKGHSNTAFVELENDVEIGQR